MQCARPRWWTGDVYVRYGLLLGRAADDALLSPYLGRLDEIRILAQPRLTTSRAALWHYTPVAHSSAPLHARQSAVVVERVALCCLCFWCCLSPPGPASNPIQRNATRRRAPPAVISHPPSAIRSRRQLHVKAPARNSTRPPAPPPSQTSPAAHGHRVLAIAALHAACCPPEPHAVACACPSAAEPAPRLLWKQLAGALSTASRPDCSHSSWLPQVPPSFALSPRPPTPPEHVCCCRFAGAWPAALPAVPPRAPPLDRRVQHHEQQPSACWRSHAPSADLLPPLHQQPRRLESEGRGQLEPPAARA